MGIPTVFGWDESDGQLLMSGLVTEMSQPADSSTWTFRGNAWAKASPDLAFPGDIHPGLLVYDSDRKREVFINRGTLNQDPQVWARGGATGWQRIETAHNFGDGFTSQLASAAYSPELHAIVLLNPEVDNGMPTWLFDGTDWRSIQTAHTLEAGKQIQLEYDPARKAVIALSLFDFRSWVFDGHDWLVQPLVGSIPAIRDYPAAGFDPERGQWLLFGGRPGTGPPYNDTWIGDGTSWIQETSSQDPSGRSFFWGGRFVAFDPLSHQSFVFGGQGGPDPNPPYFGDTWAWDGKNWAQLAGPTYAPGSTQPASPARVASPAR